VAYVVSRKVGDYLFPELLVGNGRMISEYGIGKDLRGKLA
jgi:hypothetical protein